MIPDCLVGELRATIFVSPIVYDPSNLRRVSTILKMEDGYMPNVVPPTINGLPFTFPGQAANQGIPLDWEMASQKTNLQVHFGPQKIDVLKRVHQFSQSVEERFCEEALVIFIGLVKLFNLIPTRIAYAPVYITEFNRSFKRSDFLKKIYALNQYEESEINTIFFKQGYLRQEPISDNLYKINYVADASETQNIEEDKDSDGHKRYIVHSMLNLVLDINTRQGEGYTFSIDDMVDFYNKTICRAHQFRDYYVSVG